MDLNASLKATARKPTRQIRQSHDGTETPGKVNRSLEQSFYKHGHGGQCFFDAIIDGHVEVGSVSRNVKSGRNPDGKHPPR